MRANPVDHRLHRDRQIFFGRKSGYEGRVCHGPRAISSDCHRKQERSPPFSSTKTACVSAIRQKTINAYAAEAFCEVLLRGRLARTDLHESSMCFLTKLFHSHRLFPREEFQIDEFLTFHGKQHRHKAIHLPHCRLLKSPKRPETHGGCREFRGRFSSAEVTFGKPHKLKIVNRFNYLA